jgi:drug/metabolite transporter (DMT)-like permease
VFANAAYLGCTYAALSRGLAAGIASNVASTNPLLLALVAPRLLGEPLTGKKLLGMLLGFGGVVGVMLARTGTEGLQRPAGDQHDSVAGRGPGADPSWRARVRRTNGSGQH